MVNHLHGLHVSLHSLIDSFTTVFTCFCLDSDEYDSDGSDAEADDGRPFTRTELQSKVMKTVKKRESAAKKEGFKYDLSNAREKAQKKEKKDSRK